MSQERSCQAPQHLEVRLCSRSTEDCRAGEKWGLVVGTCCPNMRQDGGVTDPTMQVASGCKSWGPSIFQMQTLAPMPLDPGLCPLCSVSEWDREYRTQ